MIGSECTVTDMALGQTQQDLLESGTRPGLSRTGGRMGKCSCQLPAEEAPTGSSPSCPPGIQAPTLGGRYHPGHKWGN